MFQLSKGEKILVLAICLSLVAVTIVITVCIVLESCWLRVCLKRIAKKRKLKYSKTDRLNEGTFIKMPDTPQYTLDCGPPSKLITTQSEVGQQGKQPSRKREDSTYSSMSSSSQGNTSISNYSEISAETPVGDIDQDLNFGQVICNIRYRNNENGSLGQLIVTVKEVQDLPPRSYGGTCDPYVELYLLRSKGRKPWVKNNNSIIYKFQTKTQRKTQHPIFKETFVMDVNKNDIKDGVLKFSILDDEKYANDSVIGEVTVPLKNIHLSSLDDEKCLKIFDLQDSAQEQGQILFGLSYLPTAERLTFNVIKANNLRKIPNNDAETFAPFVRIVLMHNGKMLKKLKTKTKPGSCSPSFKETLTLDIPQNQLDHVIILLVASYRDPQNEGLSSPDSPTSPPGSNSRKNHHIGKVVLGTSVRGAPLSHWNAMKQSPRKEVVQWHILR